MNFLKGSNSKNESSNEEFKFVSGCENISIGLINGRGYNKDLGIFVSMEISSLVLIIGNNRLLY
jgi:hypothetical protein